MNEVGFNGKFSQLQLRYQALLEESANQIEMLAHLVNVVGPNIKSRYMILVGQFEHRVYELKLEIIRWQRRFTLRQMALNCGQKPNLVAIETQLDAEFAQYIEAVRKHIQEIKDAAVIFHSEKVSDEEATAIRVAYLDAVKNLHPDINPNLHESAKDLWDQIQNAYAAQDWVHLLPRMRQVLQGRTRHPPSESTPQGGRRNLESESRMMLTSLSAPARLSPILWGFELIFRLNGRIGWSTIFELLPPTDRTNFGII